jgi:hypothetical protein
MLVGPRFGFRAATTAVERLLYVAALACLCVITGAQISAVQQARAAGHADPSYYFQTARNVAAGHGYTSDFVWQFLVLPPSVHHYAGDYWQPLPSLLMALPMLLTGDHSLITASSASIVASLLGALAAGVLAYHLTGRHALAGMTILLVALLPRLSYFAVQTESVPFYLLFLLSTLALASSRRDGSLRWVAVGGCAGATWLCRNDGLILVLVLGASLLVALLRGRHGGRAAVRLQLRRIASYTGGVGVILTPWIIANERAMHRALPPTTQLPFLGYYEQLFQVGRHGGLHDVLNHGVWAAVRFRWSLGNRLTWFLLALALLNLWVLVRVLRRRLHAAGGTVDRKRPPHDWDRIGWPTVAASAAGVFLFDAVVSPVASSAGAWLRSATAFLPLLLIAALLGACRVPWGRTVGWSALLATVAWPWLAGSSAAAAAINQNNAFGRDIAVYAGYIADAEAGRHGTVMTREPWETTEITGYPSVQIPNNDLCTIVAIGHRYGATVLVTHVTRPQADVAVLRNAGFTLLGTVGPSNVLRFPAHVSGC